MTSNVSNSSVWESSREVGLSSEKLEKHAQTLLAWEAATSDAILIVEANGAIASWNGGAERLFGYTADEAVNLTFNCLVSESHRADEERVFLAIANGEVIAPYDTIRRCKGGTLVNVSVSRTLLRNVRGEPLGFCEVVRHISEKKESKTQYATCREDVAQNNEHLSAALIAGKTGTYRLNLQTHEVHCDETLGSLYARSPSEIRSLEEALMAIHPEDRPWVQASCERCIKQGADLDIAYRVIWPDGSIRWISARGKTLRDELDRPAYLEGACVDITARRLIEGQLRDQRDVLRSIVSGAPLKEILEGLTLAVERNARRPLMASILLVDRERGRLMPIAGHRVPPGWTKLIADLEISPTTGSCGTAAHRRERVIVSEIASDPLWVSLKNEAAEFGLAACWSSPIFSSTGDVLATFAVYHSQPTVPTEWELHLVDVLTGTAAIAIERKHTEEQLRSAHEALENRARELQEVSDAVPGLIAFIDRDGRFRFCNRTFSDWYGRPCDQIIGRKIVEIVTPEMWLQIEPKMREAFRGGTVEFEIENNMLPQARTIHIVYTARRDERGKILGVIIFGNDITERKRAETALRVSEERFRSLADNIAQFAWVADAKGLIFWYNQRWFDYTGTTLEEMQGWGWTRVHHPDHVERVVKRIQHSWDTGEAWEDTFPLRAKDGTYNWFISRARPIRDEKGNVQMWFGTNTDITESRKTAQALAEAKAELQRLNDELEEEVVERSLRLQETIGELEAFSYSIVHDMRAPLRSVQGFARVVLEEHAAGLNSEGRFYLQNIAASADRMDRMVRDVLNYSKIVHGTLPMESIDIESLLRGILESYPLFSPERADIRLEGVFHPVEGNTAALTQCLSNLLSNAIKFSSSESRPLVRVWTERFDGNVRVVVEDHGEGIPADQFEKIFGLFQQLDKSRGGTGVGLAIVRKAVLRMGGRVGVESELGRGSRFWLELKEATNQL